MTTKTIYEPKYVSSHALVIGINEYDHAPRLGYARNDAEAFAQALCGKFKFPESNIALLTDGAATRNEILRVFMKYAQDGSIAGDERIVVFFAGHGYTVTGRRGETGFLVPVDGNVADLSTLIRWDDLTRNADLIPAKHMFFIMDACYGGLALTRMALAAGSMRFLRDMLQRFSRQVLTAGKADETVADANGPRPGHSIFTGHLLDALEGGAASEGVITASGVMAYVYEKVARDPYSRQTPHYGFFDGDGDFIFAADGLKGPVGEEKGATDVPIKVVGPTAPVLAEEETVAGTLKELLSTPSQQIRLDDFVSAHVRRVLQLVNVKRFPVQGVSSSKEEFASRLAGYEAAISDVATMTVLMGRWCTREQLPILDKALARLAESDKGSAGTTLWLRLGWYPILYLMYAGGVAALSADNYSTLATILKAPVHSEPHDGGELKPLTVAVIEELTEIVDAFKSLPGHERHYVPRSEHLRTRQQPLLEDLLFLGRTYDRHFDRFEILLALTYADLADRAWGPPGRFAWKHSGRVHKSPYLELMQEAERMGDDWPALRAGFFRGSAKRFKEIAESYRQSLDSLGWW